VPELPEVETIRRGLLPHLLEKKVVAVEVRDSRLRLPVRKAELQRCIGQRIVAISRRSKYLLLELSEGDVVVMHLGMSGRVLLVPKETPFERHDHVILSLPQGRHLRFRDPRRFGLVVVVRHDEVQAHPLFVNLGVEPLSQDFTAGYCHESGKNSDKPIKNFLMDASKIVGVGNIYANEALFRAGHAPKKKTRRLKLSDWQGLCVEIRNVLNEAIAQGGTTLNDFFNSNGESGYFQQSLKVYDRAGLPCFQCGKSIIKIILAGRSSFYCKNCQR